MAKKQTEKIDFSQMQKVPNKRKYQDERIYFYLSLKNRFLIYLLFIICLGIISYLLINKGIIVNELTEVSFNENNTFDYNVSLLPNTIYQSQVLDANQVYPASLTDKINTTIKYNYYLSEPMSIDYDYEIIGTLNITSPDGKIIKKEATPLLEKKSKHIKNNNKINLSENITIDYQKYYSQVQNYLNQIGPIGQATFDITINIASQGHYEIFTNDLNHNNKFTISIPLKDTQYSINTKSRNNDGSFTEIVNKKPINEIFVYLGMTFFVMDILLIIYFISFILRVSPKKTKYCRLRDGILKDYDDIIVNSKRTPSIVDQVVIDCYNFSELLDAQRTLQKPIIFSEIVHNQKCMFIIIDKETIYRYVLKECDLEY